MVLQLLFQSEPQYTNMRDFNVSVCAGYWSGVLFPVVNPLWVMGLQIESHSGFCRIKPDPSAQPTQNTVQREKGRRKQSEREKKEWRKRRAYKYVMSQRIARWKKNSQREGRSLIHLEHLLKSNTFITVLQSNVVYSCAAILGEWVSEVPTTKLSKCF